MAGAESVAFPDNLTWAQNQPDNQAGAEDCVHMRLLQSGIVLADKNCSNKYIVACEVAKKKTVRQNNLTCKFSLLVCICRVYLTRSTPNSSALDLGNIFSTGWPTLRDMECERILCQWAIGAAGWALKY